MKNATISARGNARHRLVGLQRGKKQSLHWRSSYFNDVDSHVYITLAFGSLHVGRCAQAAKKPPVTVVVAAARAAPRQVSPLALPPGCSCVGI
jgi:hypothetical protein